MQRVLDGRTGSALQEVPSPQTPVCEGRGVESTTPCKFTTPWESGAQVRAIWCRECGRPCAANYEALQATHQEVVGNSGEIATQPAEMDEVLATATILQSTEDECGELLQKQFQQLEVKHRKQKTKHNTNTKTSVAILCFSVDPPLERTQISHNTEREMLMY